MIRIVHRFDNLGGLQEELPGLQRILGEAELYTTLAQGEQGYALSILCRDENTYGTVLDSLGDFPAYAAMLLGPSVTECYQQEQFTLTDNVWVPLDRPHPAISWPGRGAVSVIIHTACEENNNWRELTAAEIAETRREPGCEFYAWFENINAPCDLLLLETWATGQLYDVHWLGRVRSTAYRGNSGRTPTPRARGEVSREFYRRQEFQFHYGRLQPVRAEDISHTIEWRA